jgi:hypothetical protein
MRKLPYLFAAAALGGVALAMTPGSASPLTSGLTSGSNVPELNDGMVQKVHGWHCRKRYGWYHGYKQWHRHRRACYDEDYRPGIYGPGIGLNFYFSDDNHHHHHHKKKKMGY